MAIVGPLGIAPRQQQAVHRHDPVDALVIDRRRPLLAQLAIEDRRYAAVAVGGPLCGDLLDARQQLRIFSLGIAPARLGAAGQTRIHGGARYAECAGDQAHRKSSGSGDRMSKVAFFGRDLSELS